MAFLAAALPFLSAGLGVAGTLMQAAGANQQAKAAENAANYNRQVQEINARTAQDQAAAKAGEVARRNRQVLAAGRAGALSNGVELTGSIGDVLTQQEDTGNLDFLTAVYDGTVAATGFRNNATLYGAQAENARAAGRIGVASALFSGVSDVFRGVGRQQMRV